MTGRAIRGRTLAPGRGAGPALVLDAPLSFWGGMDPTTGRLIDRRHPQSGADLTGRVMVMPSGRGSSSSSTVLAEAIRTGSAPAAIVLAEADPIIALGALVAAELYGRLVPVVVVTPADHARLRSGRPITVEAGSEGALIRPTGPPGPGRPGALR